MRNRTNIHYKGIPYEFSIPLALIGLLTYGISFYFIHKSPRYQNVFGTLCTAYVAFHIQTLAALMIWTIVRIFVINLSVNFPWNIFARLTSPLANSTLYGAIWVHFVLAINRLWAIAYPVDYHRIFSKRNARITVASIWLISMLITGLYYNVECVVYFESDLHSWSTLYGPCNHYYLAYIAMLLSDGVVVITVLVDAIAFYRVVKYFKISEQGSTALQETVKQDIIFFKSTCISTAIYLLFIITFNIETPMLRLIKVTYTWLAIHTLDGLAFLFFNHRFLRKRNRLGVRQNMETFGMNASVPATTARKRAQ